jgi:hypothetical protein
VKCPGPGFCPFANEGRFRLVVCLVAMVITLMAAVAVAAIIKGKDGVLTSGVCLAMSSVVTAVLIGGAHRHRKTDNEPAQLEQKGGDSHNA